MGDKTFNLTWNNHLANLSGLFEGLYKSGSLTDTTLACQGGMLRAHKLVLAACSPYFERVFKEHYGEQPILILKGVPIEEMECLLDFMYRGSINVAEEHLPSLIKTATDLEIRGLSGDERSETDNVYSRVEVEARVRACHTESRVDNSPSFPSRQMSDTAIAADCIKLEEIEVEDDPMVMEGHEEDSFEESLQTSPRVSKQTIRHVPAPMFKRQVRYDGQGRVPVGRPASGRDTDNNSSKRSHHDNHISMRDPNHHANCEDNPGSPSCGDAGIAVVKIDPASNNGNLDPTVPAIQMHEDSLERERDSLEHMNSPESESLDEPETNTESVKKRVIEVTKKRLTAMGIRDKSQYKPFPCDLCTLAFTRASHLARHRRVHTGERPFACSLCPRMFARQDKLKQHLDSHLQWPKRKALANLTSGDCGSGAGQLVNLGPGLSATTTAVAAAAIAAAKGKRGRPRKVNTRPSMIGQHSADSHDA